MTHYPEYAANELPAYIDRLEADLAAAKAGVRVSIEGAEIDVNRITAELAFARAGLGSPYGGKKRVK